MDVIRRLWRGYADGEIRPGLFLAVPGRSLHAQWSGFLFVYIRGCALMVVGVPVRI